MSTQALIIALLIAGADPAGPSSFAIVVGNNAPPQEQGAGLAELQYADDDAVRYHQLFSDLDTESHLLTVLDKQTQKRYPGLAAEVRPPTAANLEQTVSRVAEELYRAAGEDRKTQLYLIFTGHGAKTKRGNAYLSLLDGKLTRRKLYEEVIAKLPATYTHLIIDACHAGAVVGGRGFFDKEKTAKSVPVSTADLMQLTEGVELSQHPHLGIIIASAANQETHEWSEIEAGVFSHELLSGLRGPADVNQDGRVEYSEIHAFVSAANREVKDPKAIPTMTAIPPARNHNVALVSLDALQNTTFLTGDPSGLGHFHIELTGGQRLLDANLSHMAQTRIAVPRTTLAFLRTGKREAELKGDKPDTLALESLEFQPIQEASRGNIDISFRQGLFAAGYGETYYKGFVDSRGDVPVAFANTEPEALNVTAGGTPTDRSLLPLGLAATSAVAGGLCIAATALALSARQKVNDTNLQRQAHEANDRYVLFGNGALLTGTTAIATGFLSWWLWE